MKKLLFKLTALSLALSICASLAACGGAGGAQSTTTGSAAVGGTGGAESTPNIYDNSPNKDKWDRNNYGSWADGIWDSAVLPSYFPTQPAGEMKELQTTYTAKNDKLLGSTFNIGEIAVDYQVEHYGVFFQGTLEQAKSIKAEMVQKGFLVRTVSEDNFMTGDEEVKRYECYAKDKFVCIYLNERYGTEAGETCPYGISITSVEKIYDYPTTFAGLPLPKGYILSEPTYSQVEGDEYDYVDYPMTTAPTAEYWGIYEMSFMSISLAEYESYIASVKSAGYKLTSETKPTASENKYYARLNNGENYLLLTYYADDNYIVLGFSNYDGWWG